MLDQFLPFHRPSIEEEEIASVTAMLRSGWLTTGAKVREFEQAFAKAVGATYAVAVNSCTAALHLALEAVEVQAGDEVITTPLSFFATAGVIARLGARPVFADIDPVTYNLSPSEVEQVITSRTKAILPVHLYGQCADMKPILELAAQHGLKVVEDAAQALGAEYRDGRRAGNMGTLGCLSFFPSKNLGGFGDGGMVVTNDEELMERIRILRVQGGKPKYYHKFIGGNFRLDTLQAAILNVKFPYLDRWTSLRQQNAERYSVLFKESGLIEKIGLQLAKAIYQDSGVNHYHINNQFVIRVPNRDGLRKYLKENEIGNEVYYPVPFHLQECLRDLGYHEGDFPHAELACKETLGLPIYPELEQHQQEQVVSRVQEFYNR